MKLNFGGMIPISTVDWYGRSASVIFFNGCPLRCLYCQNYKLLDENKPVELEEIEKKILSAKSFISAVVFSGGEPTMQYEALESLARFVKDNGMLVGVETNGYYPERLKHLIKKKLVDRLFLDIKAPVHSDKYSIITGGVEDAGERVFESLQLIDIPLEVRTTAFRSFSDISGIAESLIGRDLTYVIQQGLPENAPDGEIRKEKPLARDELAALAESVSFLKDVRIRTKENGEERIC
ncbi:MAG: anaerobic ribonucleoside-triphosphate reductase activating protein [Candidatus Methanoperedens sp.]|nr:anaerobic ribonucleoside-triphosphate reductase activating protein [Candidatus Methanoperedens sp.]PKL53071.1 MAG: anaerobic ribonucleoside-triphosphate reductase activating protein [Candidatus Methanoperedenaceae archaeon HGW-Methanoperedenaceae-1]